MAWTLLALWGQRLSVPQVHWRRWLVLATYVWAFFLQVDMGPSSIVRLQAPLVALWLLLGAWQLAELVPTTRHVVLAGVVLTTLVTWPFVHRTSNEDVSAGLIHDAVQQLPARDACLVTLHEADPPDKGKVQRAFPDYLLRPPHREVKRFSMSEWQANGAPQCAGGTFLLIDHRCYGIYHHAATEPSMLPICSETLANHRWDETLPLLVANHGQNDYGWYPDLKFFKLGLYRLHP